MAIRDSAIHQRDDQSLGILLGYLLECPEVMWSRRNPSFARDFGGAKRDPTAEESSCSKVNRPDLQKQLMAAFEISEGRVDELIEVGREALKDPGREVERTTWRNAMYFRSVQLDSCLSLLALELTADSSLRIVRIDSQEYERRRDLYDRGQAGDFIVEDTPSLRDMPDSLKAAMKFMLNVATGA